MLADKVNKYTIQGNMREEVAAREVDPRYPRCLWFMIVCAFDASRLFEWSCCATGLEISL